MADKLIVYPDADEGDAVILTPARIARLEQFATFVVHYGRPQSESEYIDRVKDAVGVLLGWDMYKNVMNAATKLEVISFAGIGVAKYVDLESAARQSVTVCNSPGYADNTVAEHTLALLLAACRHVPQLHHALRQGHWDQTRQGFELKGKTIGLVGFGGIAARFAQMCLALGLTVQAWTRNAGAERARQHGVTFVPLDNLLESSDIVSVHLASTPDTNGLLDFSAMGKLKPGALFVNTARAELVDEDALRTALEEGRIRAAALDVYHDEPLPEGHWLLARDDVVLSPHVAYKTPESTGALYDIAIDNLVHFFQGKAVNVVTV